MTYLKKFAPNKWMPTSEIELMVTGPKVTSGYCWPCLIADLRTVYTLSIDGVCARCGRNISTDPDGMLETALGELRKENNGIKR